MKKSKNKTVALLLASVLLITVASCKKDKNEPEPDPTPNPTATKYIAASFSDVTTGQGFMRGYLGLPSSPIDNSSSTNAIQTANAGGVVYGDAYYCPKIDGTFGFSKYKMDASGNLTLNGSITITSYLADIQIIDDNNGLYIDIGGASIGKFNPSNMTGAGTISLAGFTAALPAYLQTKAAIGPREMIKRGNTLFVAMNVANDAYGTGSPDTAFVAVVDLTTNTYVSMTMKAGSKLAGDVYSYSTGMVLGSNNDLYVGCVSNYFAGASDKFEILRIPSTSTSFDSYFWDVSTTAGMPRSGRWLISGGGDIAFTTLNDPTISDPQTDPAFFSSKSFKTFKLDLVAKTANVVGSGIYSTGFLQGGMYKEGDNMIIPITNSSTNAFYSYGITSGSFAKIADVTGGGVPISIAKIQ